MAEFDPARFETLVGMYDKNRLSEIGSNVQPRTIEKLRDGSYDITFTVQPGATPEEKDATRRAQFAYESLVLNQKSVDDVDMVTVYEHETDQGYRMKAVINAAHEMPSERYDPSIFREPNRPYILVTHDE